MFVSASVDPGRFFFYRSSTFLTERDRMWTWIFGFCFVLAALTAFLFARWTNFWEERSTYWKESSEDWEKKHHDAQAELFNALAGYCRKDFFRRGLCAEVEVTTRGDERECRFHAAPFEEDGESWSFRVDMKNAIAPVWLSITAQPGGERTHLFLSFKPGEKWHRRAIALFEALRHDSGGSRLTHLEALSLVRAFLGADQKPLLTSRITFDPVSVANRQD